MILMHLPRTLLLCLLSCLVTPSVGGDINPRLPGNPYRHIPQRNVFALRSPQPQTAKVQQPAPPLPQVRLTGITTIFGDKRALLEVRLAAKPSEPAREQRYILTEGKRGGPITVLEIDEKANTVKVDNSGTISVIGFDKPKVAPPAATPGPQPPGRRLPYPIISR